MNDANGNAVAGNPSIKPLGRESRVPLYVQIKRQLREMLEKQEKHEERVFTDQELAALFGVARMTVRQAIKELVDEGLVYRVRGLGTFLSSPKVTDSLQQWHNRFEDWAVQGHSVSMEILDFRMTEAGTDIARRLLLPERTEVVYISRLWYVDGVPMGLGYFYVHPSIGCLLSRSDVEHQHVYAAVTQHLTKPILGEQVEIEAAVASNVMAARLRIREGDPVLVRRVTQLYGDNEPLVAANSFFRADLYKYSVYVSADPRNSVAKGLSARVNPVVEHVVAGDVQIQSRD